MNTSGARAGYSPAPWPDIPRPAMPVSQTFDEWQDRQQQWWRDIRLQLDRELRKAAASQFTKGMIMSWRRPIAEIPDGWHLANGEMGTVDLRDSFIKCVGADEEPGARGGAAEHAPAGVVSAPLFSGEVGFTQGVSAGIPSGTFVGDTGVTSEETAGTPIATFTGTSANTNSVSGGTPAGTNATESAHTHEFAASSTLITPDLVAPDVTATGVAPAGTTGAGSAHTHTFTGSALAGHLHAVTATGTIECDEMDVHSHTFTPTGTLTGNPMGLHAHGFMPAGTNSAPAFTGSPGNFEPPYYKLAFIEKL